MAQAIGRFGPYVHGLNKGKLVDIVRTSSLRGTCGSSYMVNDDPTVRAYVGTFEHQKKSKNWSGSAATIIEFHTETPPRGQLPQGDAHGSGGALKNGHLDIRISRIVDGDGRVVPPGSYASR